MPNGSNLLGSSGYSSSTNQGAAIVPVIDSPGKYYLFSLRNFNFSTDTMSGLSYSIVDMNLNGGLGDVVVKNITLDKGPLQESMVVVPGSNCDVWLFVHPHHDTIFKAFHITREGVAIEPVISSPGSAMGGAMAAFELGSMSVSPDRSMIAITSYSMSCMALGLVPSLGGVLLAKFDPETGQLSNGIKVSDSIASYSTCFSPDNSKLYVQGISADSAGGEGPTVLWQYDVREQTQPAVRASKYLVQTYDPDDQFLGMRRWKDTIIMSNLQYIAAPDQKGGSCNFRAEPYVEIDSFNIASTGGWNMALGVDVVYPLPMDTVFRLMADTTVCASIVLKSPAAYTSYLWDDNTTDTVREARASGRYWVQYNDGCHFGVDTFAVHIPELNPVINVHVFELGTTESYKTYQWLFNGALIPGATDSIYVVSENGAYRVIVSDEYGCTDTSEVYQVTNVGITQRETAREIYIYPNPAQSVIHVNTPIDVDVTLVSVTGAVVRKWQHAQTLSVDDLADGVYLLRVTDQYGMLIKVEKFIKLH